MQIHKCESSSTLDLSIFSFSNCMKYFNVQIQVSRLRGAGPFLSESIKQMKKYSWTGYQSYGYKYWSKLTEGASLVAQWLRVRLPMQGTWVCAPVWERLGP